MIYDIPHFLAGDVKEMPDYDCWGICWK